MKNAVQPASQRIILLIVLGYEGAGALLGGTLLMITPDGRSMDMPVEIMHGAFRDFLIPGMILFGLGVLNTIAFFALLRHARSSWFLAGAAAGALAIWFWVEIAILEELHWLHAMWGLPVVVGCVVVLPQIFPRHLSPRKALLACGILSSVLYMAINIIVPLRYPGYDLASFTPSELSAIGAPSRMLWSVLATPYTFLILAFVWGIRRSAGSDRRLHIVSVLMFTYGALGLLWPFAPMHQREVLAAGGGTFSDTLHLTLGAITVLLYLAALGVAAGAFGRGFRVYSIATFVAAVLFGVLTFLDAPGLAQNRPTPLIGVWERINIGVFLIWIIVLAIMLWRRPPTAQEEKNTPRSALKR